MRNHLRSVIFGLAGLAVIGSGVVFLRSGAPTTPRLVSQSASVQSSPTATGTATPSASAALASLPGVPEDVFQRGSISLTTSSNDLNELATPESTAAARAAEITRSPWFHRYPLQYKGAVLVEVHYPAGVAASSTLDWLFVYYSSVPFEPAGCPQGENCSGHYFTVAIDAVTGQPDINLTGIKSNT